MSFLNFFSSFFQKNKQFSPLLKNKNLLKTVDALNTYSDLTVLLNSYIDNKESKIVLPLVILDKQRGLYIFELRQWKRKELQNIEIETTKVTKRADNNLAFSFVHELIEQKISHLKISLPIYNFLILESINTKEYEELESSVQRYLPQDFLIFQDTDSAELFQKIHTLENKNLHLDDEILFSLYPQYTLEENNRKLFANAQQRKFVHNSTEKITNLRGKAKSGKSSAIILKVLEILSRNPNKKILLLSTNQSVKEHLQQNIQTASSKRGISIDTLTIIDVKSFLQNAYKQLNIDLAKDNSHTPLYIDERLLKKRKKAADLLVCDDAQLLEEPFLNYLELIQHKAQIIFVNHPKKYENEFLLHDSFFKPKERISFIEGSPLIQVMHHITKLLHTAQQDKSILICSNELTQQKLQEDLQNYIDPLQYTTLFYSNYTTIPDIVTPHIILLDICQFKTEIVEYALTRATHSVALFYEQECGSLKILKENYES